MKPAALGLAILIGAASVSAAAILCPRAAQRIGALGEAIGGPHAIGRVGDFLLENDQIRLVIADTGVDPKDPSKSTFGRVNTTFGGTLVDADLRRVGGDGARGNDQLAELLPGFVFSVINPTSVAVTGAGDDGTPAEITVTGTPSDLLQMVYLLNVGLVGPTSLTLTQTYRLAPASATSRSRPRSRTPARGTSVPFLDPTELKDLGFNIPDRHDQAQRADGTAAAARRRAAAVRARDRRLQRAVRDRGQLRSGRRVPRVPGLAIDYLASRGAGVSYGLTVPKSPNNYVNAYASGYPGQRITPYSMLVRSPTPGSPASTWSSRRTSSVPRSSSRTPRTSSSARAMSRRWPTRSTSCTARRPARSAAA